MLPWFRPWVIVDPSRSVHEDVGRKEAIVPTISLENEINVICDRHKWERGTRKTALYTVLREFQPSSIKSHLASGLMKSVSTLDASGHCGQLCRMKMLYLKVRVPLTYHDRHHLVQPIRGQAAGCRQTN